VIVIALLLAATAQANVTFVNPQPGGQAVGAQWIEVTTDAPNVDRVEFSIDRVLAGVARKAPYKIAYDFGTALTSREITAKVLYDRYRKTELATIHTIALTAGDSMNVDVVEVPLRIRSPRTLRAEDLGVRENDVEQTIRDIKPGRGPAHFAFVVDRSLSMGGGKLDAALRAVDEGMKLLRADDTASLILFNHNVSKPLTLPRSRGAVVASGGTSLRDAVASIPLTGRTYAIVITDGGDRNSQLSDEEALRKISGTKTIVAAAVFGDAGHFLQRATNNTGGSLVEATVETVTSKVRGIIADINSRYLMIYQSHGTRSGWRSITITPKLRTIQILAARKGYFAA
jgi:hypothetical protein